MHVVNSAPSREVFPNVEVEGLEEDITLVAELRAEQQIDIAASLALFAVLLLGDTESPTVQEPRPIVTLPEMSLDRLVHRELESGYQREQGGANRKLLEV